MCQTSLSAIEYLIESKKIALVANGNVCGIFDLTGGSLEHQDLRFR